MNAARTSVKASLADADSLADASQQAPADPATLWPSQQQPPSSRAPQAPATHSSRWLVLVASGMLVIAAAAVVSSIVSSSSNSAGSDTQSSSSSSDSSVLAPAAGNGTVVYLGNGCFWERQKAYADLELGAEGAFKRSMNTVTSVVGYAGGTGVSSDGLVCYHHPGSNQGNTYGNLGHCEVVAVVVDDKGQFQSLAQDFFSSFTQTASGMQRPDPGDRGLEYRSVIGISGGINGPLYEIVKEANVHGMVLREGQGDESDEFNTVYIMDIDRFPFFRGEQYHQFHSNFFGAAYPRSYLDDLRAAQLDAGHIATTGCPESQQHWRQLRGGSR